MVCCAYRGREGGEHTYPSSPQSAPQLFRTLHHFFVACTPTICTTQHNNTESVSRITCRGKYKGGTGWGLLWATWTQWLTSLPQLDTVPDW